MSDERETTVPPGAAERGKRLAAGLVARLSRAGLSSADEGGATVLSRDGVVVARVVPDSGFAVVEVNPRAGVGDAVALRRIGTSHPDPARSAAGWRRSEVRTRRDAAVALHALERRGVPDPRLRGREALREGPVGVVRVRRVDEPKREGDGTRVLVDAVWPKGLPKDGGAIDEWMPGVAPSAALHKAFGPAPARTRGFRRAYLAELRGGAKAEDVSRLRTHLRRGALTLVTVVRDVDLSAATVLAAAVARAKTPRG